MQIINLSPQDRKLAILALLAGCFSPAASMGPHLLAMTALFAVWLGQPAQNACAQFPTVALQPVSVDQLVSPVAITNAGDSSNRLFVADQRGKINILQNGSLLSSPFLDLGGKLVPERANFDERGLLGLAFHPNFGKAGATNNDKFYVYYTASKPGGNPSDPVNPVDSQSVVAEYRVSALGSNVADPNSERILMTFDKPQFNHNGGWLGFGPDNKLYITTGDGGGADDNGAGHTGGASSKPAGGLGNSQDLSKLLGKVLRIDVDDTSSGPYGIPADNPFAGQAGARPEIYAYGLRNPWRGSFDRQTGDLIVADVGQGKVEEINKIVKGGNYGWRVKEGTFDFDATVTRPNSDPLLDPIAEYAHPGANLGISEVGLAAIGGVVYRGSEFPALQGSYVFGDWSSGFGTPNGTLLALNPNDGKLLHDVVQLNVAGGNPIGQFIQGFGEDENGEIYVALKRTLAASGLGQDGKPTGGIYKLTVVPEPHAVLLLSCLGFSLHLFRRTTRERRRN